MSGGLERHRREWTGRLLALRDALGELYAAEAAALSRDLQRWGKGFLVALLLVFAALALLFWLLAVVVATLVAVLAVWLPVWGAMLATLGLLLVAVGTLGALAWFRMRKLGGPMALIGRRWRDHLDWWHERVLAEPAGEEGEDGAQH
jgi:hypothetical protein